MNYIPDCDSFSGFGPRCKPGKHLPGTPINIKSEKFASDRFKRKGCDRPHCPHCLFHLDTEGAT